MKVMLTVSGPGPVWTSRSPGRGNPRYKPDPAEYADFATAVASRYGADVDRYILLNEPNLPSWLQPQASCAHRRCTPVAPHLYRGLVRAAYPAIKAADPGAEVLIGALSSRGLDMKARNSTLRPLVFLRALGCVSSRFARLRSGDCKGFKPATADGFAFHPHGTLTSPDRAYRNRDDVNLASLPRLESALDRLQRGGGCARPRGASTSSSTSTATRRARPTGPPGLARHPGPLLQGAAYRAWRDPRVRLLAQYQWYDEPLRQASSAFAGWQSGLRFLSGRAKPALAHFDADAGRSARSRLSGQARPGDAQTVTVERRPRGASGAR